MSLILWLLLILLLLFRWMVFFQSYVRLGWLPKNQKSENQKSKTWFEWYILQAKCSFQCPANRLKAFMVKLLILINLVFLKKFVSIYLHSNHIAHCCETQLLVGNCSSRYPKQKLQFL